MLCTAGVFPPSDLSTAEESRRSTERLTNLAWLPDDERGYHDLVCPGN
jgi:hypothetical protein